MTPRNRGRGLAPGSMHPERDAKIVQLRQQGLSFREIGRRVDLTGERVRAIFKRAMKEAGK